MVRVIDNFNTSMKDELVWLLRRADEAYFISAFIQNSGVDLLKSHLSDFIRKGKNIYFLFGNAFGITDRKAIEILGSLGVIQKIYSGSFMFHPKAYIFKIDGELQAIVGSSNWSESALTSGIEWNVLLNPGSRASIQVYNQFFRLWNSSETLEVTPSILDQLGKRTKIDDMGIKPGKIQLEPLDIDFFDEIEPPKGKGQSDYDRIRLQRIGELLSNPANYFVRNTQVGSDQWWFNVYENKLFKKATAGHFNIVVRCDPDTSHEVIFAIPSEYFFSNILPNTSSTPSKRGGPSDSKRYIFHVIKRTHMFYWRDGLKHDGKQFII